MTDSVLSALQRRLLAFERTAWLPELATGTVTGHQSRLGGAALLRPSEEWPRCENCGTPMPLFVQLASAELPAPMADVLGGGTLQLFYCTSTDPLCESACEAFFPHARSTLLRLLPAGELLEEGPSTEAPGFPGRAIIGWKPIVDFPDWEELQALGVELSDAEGDQLADSEFPRSGEKLGGWPLWVQGVEYPSCRRCGQPLALLLQIDSEQGIPWQFGDAGVGHITQCPAHPEELAFGWACS